MAFRVGEKVVCVDDVAHGRYSPFVPSGRGLEGLTKGSIYTIRFIGNSLGVLVVRLEEITRRNSMVAGGENFYAAARFRPVVERKTDISVFTAILKSASPKVDA